MLVVKILDKLLHFSEPVCSSVEWGRQGAVILSP